MTPEAFTALAAQGYNRIPVSTEVLADLETPISAYRKLAEGPYSFLFESVQGGEKWGRYSIIGLPCRTVMTVSGHAVEIHENGECVHAETVDDPLAFVEAFQSRYKAAEDETLPVFHGGLVGYFGYDTVRYVEPRLNPCPNPDPLQTPDILLMVSEDVVVFDNLSGKLYIITVADPQLDAAYEMAQQRLDELVEQLRCNRPVYARGPLGNDIREEDFVSVCSRPEFEHAVDRIKNYIVEGDCMQVVLSQLEQSFSAPVLTAEDRDRLQGLQSLLCGNLQVCLCTANAAFFCVCVRVSLVCVRRSFCFAFGVAGGVRSVQSLCCNNLQQPT